MGETADSTFLYHLGYTDVNGKYLFFFGVGTNAAGSTVVAQQLNYTTQRKQFSTAAQDTATVNFKLIPTR
jgi:hypothetical protein